MANYIGPTGLNYLWGKVKSLVSGKANTADLATVATSGSYTDLDDKPTIPTVPTNLSSFTDDLGSSPTHTHSQYLTSAPVTSVNGQTGAVSLSIPTVPSNIVTGTSSSYTIWVGTQAQYEAISTKDATTIYLITGS